MLEQRYLSQQQQNLEGRSNKVRNTVVSKIPFSSHLEGHLEKKKPTINDKMILADHFLCYSKDYPLNSLSESTGLHCQVY